MTRGELPFRKGTSSHLVLSGPSAVAIVVRCFAELTLRFTSSDFSSSMRTAIGVVFLPRDLLALLAIYRPVDTKNELDYLF